MSGLNPAVGRTGEAELDAGDILIAIGEECAGMSAIIEDVQAFLGSQLSEAHIRLDHRSIQQLQEIDRATQTLNDLGNVAKLLGMNLSGKTILERDLRPVLRLQSLFDRLTTR